MFGEFIELITKHHPYGPQLNHTLPVAKIQNDTDGKVGYYNDNGFTFELANEDNIKHYTSAAAMEEADTMEAIKKAEEWADKKHGRGGGRRRRKTKKSKRRSRKTRRGRK